MGYDGDMLTDEVAQVHRSPGFITSNLVGKRADGSLIKEFEASHGTVADLYHAHLRGEETSMNPLGMVMALVDAMDHAATFDPNSKAAVNQLIQPLPTRFPLPPTLFLHLPFLPTLEWSCPSSLPQSPCFTAPVFGSSEQDSPSPPTTLDAI